MYAFVDKASREIKLLASVSTSMSVVQQVVALLVV